MTQATYPAGITPKGYQQITVDDTAGGLALTVPAGSVRAVCNVEAAALRWRDDGTAPTASLGTLQKADTHFELHGPESLKAFRAIKDDSTNAVLNISYYG